MIEDFDKPSAARIQQHLNALSDSNALIAELNTKPSLTEDEQDTLLRNLDHVEIMRAKKFWKGDENLDAKTREEAAKRK
jgi:hypothetical protein